jgi:hypothetical protein
MNFLRPLALTLLMGKIHQANLYGQYWFIKNHKLCKLSP